MAFSSLSLNMGGRTPRSPMLVPPQFNSCSVFRGPVAAMVMYIMSVHFYRCGERAQYSPGLRKYCSQLEKAIDDSSIAFKQSKLSPSYSRGQGYIMVTSLSHTRGHLCPLPRTLSRLIIFYIRGHQGLSYSLCSNRSIPPLLCNNIHG